MNNFYSPEHSQHRRRSAYVVLHTYVLRKASTLGMKNAVSQD